MSKRSDQKGPPSQPAPLPSARDLIREGNREIGAQIRAAVDNILRKGASVSSADLRKWGPRGVGYFFEVLRRRIAEELSSTQLPAQPAVPQTRQKPAGDRVWKTDTPQTVKTDRADPATPPLSTERDWAEQQSNRWSTRMRVLMRGIILAVMLFMSGAALVRLWPASYAEVQQQIQNSR